MIVLLFAHPYERRSRAGASLLEAVADLPELRIRRLYELYPDFDIDVATERSEVEAARLLIWMHPLYWYGPPGLLKHWFDTVLGAGWAYGEDGTALHGKDCLWVTTTGAPFEDYAIDGRHGHAMSEFQRPLERTARFCGMNWLPPLVLHQAGRLSQSELAAAGQGLRTRLLEWTSRHG